MKPRLLLIALLAMAAAAQTPRGYVTGLTGDVSALGPGSVPATLGTSGVTPGTCGDATHSCSLTIDAKGRITLQSNNVISTSGVGTVTHTVGPLTAGQLLVGNGSGDLKTGDLSGDVTTSGGTVTTLPTVNSAPGSCGDSTHICQVTTNGKGLVTAQTTYTISGGGGGGASLATQLLDFAPVIGAGAVTFGGSCSAGTPCYVTLSGARFPFTNSSSATPASGTANDTLYFYIDGTGTRTVGWNSANTYTLTNASAATGISAFPAGTYSLYTCAVVSGAVTSCSDYRAILAKTVLSASQGVGMNSAAGVYSFLLSELVDTVSTTSYSVPGTACGHFELGTSTTAGTWGLPQPGAGGMMPNGCAIEFKPLTAAITLAPTSATIGGNATYTVVAGHVCRVISDGTNYQTAACN